jgi:hypothetical protein
MENSEAWISGDLRNYRSLLLLEIVYYAGNPHMHVNELRAEIRNPFQRVKFGGYHINDLF